MVNMNFTAKHKQSTRPSQPDWATLLKQYRKRYNYSQSDIAHLFDVDHTAVSHWERGKAAIPQEVCWLLHRDYLKRKGVR